jgi:hypothetical protein
MRQLMKTQNWRLTFHNSILGWFLVSARCKGCKTLYSHDIPLHVQDYCEATLKNGRLLLSPGAQEVVSAYPDARAGKYAVKSWEAIAKPAKARNLPAPPHLDWDDAEYAGDEQDGVYYGAVKRGRWWWALATVDSNTGGFVDTLCEERHRSRKLAEIVARNAALKWCCYNGVEV